MAVDFIKSADIEKNIGDGIQIVNFYAEWCGPCKMLAPILEDISSEYEVFKVNADENKEYMTKEGIQSIPTTRIYKDGKIIDTLTGFVPKEQILNKLK